ncbi:MAG TPA: DJ-1/PfpI family protein [Clostridia bacterium]|nr:DJ-1/PfpI family protein [Clostridia bacterium]
MGKILCFVYNDMADFELTLATHFAGHYAGREIVPIAYDKAAVAAKPGLLYFPKATVTEALQLEDVDGLIIPGGWNSEQRPELTELIRRLDGENKLLAAICAGPQYFARAGVLGNHKYTTTLTTEELKESGEVDFFPRYNFLDEKIVRDRNMITAVGVAFVDFAVEIGDYLGIYEKPEEKKEYSDAYKGLL